MEPDRAAAILSLLSHELRGPLGVIRGYLKLLDQAAPPLADPERRAVAAALRASDRAAELLAQTSLLANLQRGDVTPARRTVALTDILAAAMAEARTSADRPVTYEAPGLPPIRVEADAALLAGAMASLVTAVARARPMDPQVVITAARDARGSTAGVATRIGGPGAVAGTPQAIDITRGGLGLDLPVAAALIAAHGGTLDELREGTRFAGVVVWLPTTP